MQKFILRSGNMKIKKRSKYTLQDQLYDYFKEQKKVKIAKNKLCKMFDVKDKRTISHALEALEMQKKIKIKPNIVDGTYCTNEYIFRG